MSKKTLFNILLISIISISILPMSLFSMETSKIQKRGMVMVPKKAPQGINLETCLVCRRGISRGDEARSLQCQHWDALHECCFTRRPIRCQMCEDERTAQKLKESGVIADSVTIIGKTFEMPQRNRRQEITREPGCFVCRRPIEGGTEGTSLTCGHGQLCHEACLDVEPCEFCARAIPEDQMQEMGEPPLLGITNNENNAPANNPNNDNNRSWFMKLRWPRIAMVATCVVLCGVFASKWFGWR